MRAYCFGFIGSARTDAQNSTLPLPTYLPTPKHCPWSYPMRDELLDSLTNHRALNRNKSNFSLEKGGPIRTYYFQNFNFPFRHFFVETPVVINLKTLGMGLSLTWQK